MLRLRDEEHLTLREIGERYGLSTERVRQITNRCRYTLQNSDHPPQRGTAPRSGSTAP